MPKATNTATPTAPAAEAAKAPAFTPTFTDTAVPEQIRTAKVNPYTDTAKFLADNRDKARETTMPATVVEAQNRLAREAGKAQGVTIRSKSSAADKDGNVTVTLWAVDAIRRPRKDEDK